MTTPAPQVGSTRVSSGSSSSSKAGVPKPTAAALATVVTVLGVYAIYSTANFLWALWTTDGLKSIGKIVLCVVCPKRKHPPFP